MVSHDDVLGALAAVGCSWRIEVPEKPASDDEHRSIRTVVSDVSLSFLRDDDEAGSRLYKVIKADRSVDQGDHSPRQGPLWSSREGADQP